MRSYLLCMLSGVLLFSFSAAQAQNMHPAHDMSQHSAMHAQIWHSQGVIKNVSPTSLSIAHQAIAALNWPPMTMQFSLAQGNNLPPVKVGDKVNFSFIQDEEGYQIVSLTPAE
ncbi:copper-binding protein [Vagococcus sp. WN89Y]|uniref:copper-binding protein n=1 Tax=Vagococcus sp. WN89Y TaxID=3457258 RepID=UPI003FCD7221